MKVIKNINNNVSVCLDDDGNELIAFGRGIGFKTPPYEIEDLTIVTRTFYDVNHRYFDLINLISDDIFEVSAKIVDYAKSKILTVLNPNIVFTLADHIQFALKRYDEKMYMKFSSYHDLKHFNPNEVQIGHFALKVIKKDLGVDLSLDEAYSIALHFINAESVDSKTQKSFSNHKVVEDIIEIIEKDFKMTIDQSGFNYSRFASHMDYLLDRGMTGQSVVSNNSSMFRSLKEEFPATYDTAARVAQYLEQEIDLELSEEEQLYLMLHINRLCAREDCNQ